MAQKLWTLKEFLAEAEKRFPMVTDGSVRQLIYRGIVPTASTSSTDSKKFDRKSLQALESFLVERSSSYRAYLAGLSARSSVDVQASDSLKRVELIIGAPGPIAQRMVEDNGLPAGLVKVSAKSKREWESAAEVWAAANKRHELAVKMQRAKYYKSRKRGK